MNSVVALIAQYLFNKRRKINMAWPFRKKEKTDKRALEEQKARELKIRTRNKIEQMDDMLIKIQVKKKELVGKIIEANDKKLDLRAKQAKNILAQYLKQEKQIQDMSMNLELVLQMRDLTEISRQFYEGVSELSQSISSDFGKLKAEKAGKDFMKAMYVVKKQNDQMEQLLSSSDSILQDFAGDEEVGEFDEEITAMVEKASQYN